jgi:hypothetical protein
MGVKPGPNAMIRRVNSHHHDQYGFGSSGTGITFEDSQSEFNGLPGGHGGNTGGIKFSAHDITFIATGPGKSSFSFNNGPGIWGDVGFENYLIRGITLRENARAAVHIEIAANNIPLGNYTGGVVEFCLMVKNGYEEQPPRSLMYDSACQVGHSPKCTVRNNVSYGDYRGFGGHQQDRLWQTNHQPTDGVTYNELRDLLVQDNVVYLLAATTNMWHAGTFTGDLAAGIARGGGPNPWLAAANNHFFGNVYHVHSSIANPFRWSTGKIGWTQWKGFGHDLAGSFDTFSTNPSEPAHPLGGAPPDPDPEPEPEPIGGGLGSTAPIGSTGRSRSNRAGGRRVR